MRRVAPHLEVVLAGRSMDALAAVARASAIVSFDETPSLRVAADADLDDELDGAGVVLIQARYGGYEARLHDESFPLRFDIPGDEGLGPGGLASAWRSWPPLHGLLTRISKFAPEALVLLMTAPLGILVRLASQEFGELRVAGICELPWVTLRDACEAEGIDARQTRFGYAGINHIGWLFGVTHGEHNLPTMPLKYLRLHTEQRAVVDEQVASAPRAQQLMQLRTLALKTYGWGEREQIVEVLGQRAAPWYSDAVAPFIAGMIEGDASIPFFLSTHNDGYLPDVAPDDVIEIPHRIAGGRLLRQASAPAPKEIVETLLRFIAYERSAAEAVRIRSRQDVAASLAIHPWVGESASLPLLCECICGNT